MTNKEKGILSQLTETKDIETYITTRLAMLKGREKDIIKNLEPSKREPAIKQLKGRRKELKKLKEVVNSEGCKQYSKRNWNHVAVNQDEGVEAGE